MPIRVTSDEVKQIIETDIVDITQFISIASLVVDEELTNKNMSDERLKYLELLLSAHFITLRDRQLKSDKLGDAQEEYSNIYEMGYKSSNYGQTAINLDTSKTLLHIDKLKLKFNLLS